MKHDRTKVLQTVEDDFTDTNDGCRDGDGTDGGRQCDRDTGPSW